MAEFSNFIPAPVSDLDELARLLNFWNEEVCKKQEKGESYIYSVALVTEGDDAGKNVVWFKDSETEPLAPTKLEAFTTTLSDEERRKAILAIETAGKLETRSSAIVLIGGEQKWVTLFDPAPAVESPAPKTADTTPPISKPLSDGSLGQITSDHWLSGATKVPIGSGKALTPLFVVIHFTEGWEASTSIDGWKKRTDGVYAHVIVDRNGKVFQIRPFNQICFHAGGSRWRHPATHELLKSVNSHSIGIEISNTGDGGDSQLHNHLKQGIGITGLEEARHRNANIKGSNAADTRKNPRTHWEVYPPAQLESVFEVVNLLMAKYGLVDITGHDCIKFDEKTDPGPTFPMKKLREENGLSGLPVVWNTEGNKIDV